MKRRYLGIFISLITLILTGCGGVQLQIGPKEKETSDIPAPMVQEKVISALVK
ncbi:MAG: hypothetical protein PHH44_03030 [bacterium]|nr:hypothetical protein [bacterium]